MSSPNEIEDDIYFDISAPDPIPVKVVKRVETQPLIPKSKPFTTSQKISIAFAGGGITTVALYYYLIQFVIECTKNPYL